MHRANTLADALARIPTDRHVHYSVESREGTPRWFARWKTDDGKRRAVSLGARLPQERPDHPCAHVGQLYHWRAPTTEEERRAYQDQGRRGNALRRHRSNQFKKRRQLERLRELGVTV